MSDNPVILTSETSEWLKAISRAVVQRGLRLRVVADPDQPYVPIFELLDGDDADARTPEELP